MLNQTIAHYKVLKKLGKGGMGEVYLAQDTILQRKTALKLLSAQLSGDDEFKARFKQEAQAAAALKHPNIVTIYGMDAIDDCFYIAMEFVDGEPLTNVIPKDLPTMEVLRITMQVCEGLAAAHRGGIVHRDIKPANIMMENTGLVKILDFGLAKLRTRTSLTTHSMVMGTIPYMSPEQIQAKKIDHRSDIFSLGVVFYEMLTLRHPFQGELSEAISYAILNTEPEPLSRYKQGISTGLQRIVDKALDKDVETRYQHVEDFLADLKKEAKHYSGDNQQTVTIHVDKSISTGTPKTSRSEEYTKTSKRNVKLIVSGVFLLLFILIATQLTDWVRVSEVKSKLTHSSLMFELIQISNTSQLKDQMTEYSQEMRIAVGSKEDFMNPEGCYVFLLNDNEVAGVFVYKDEAFHDVNSQETFLDLPDNLKDAVPIWVQDFSESENR